MNNRMPGNRSGGPQERQRSPIPEQGEPTLLEQNAPRFQNPQEYGKWLKGTVSRAEISGDFRRLGDGLGLLSHLNGQTDSKVEALVRVLVEKGVLEFQAYKDMAEVQMQFKQVLDTVNFMMKGEPMKDKVTLVLQWNEEHPGHYIHGSYVVGLIDWLKRNPDNMDLLFRVQVATSTHLDVEKLFNPEDLIGLAATVPPEAPATPEVGISSKEVFGSPAIIMGPPPTTEEK